MTVAVIEKMIEELLKRLFRYLPCVICKQKGKTYTRTVKHHIIKVARGKFFKYSVWNIAPLCGHHHIFCAKKSPHASDNFFKWLKKYMPKHFAWYEKHNNHKFDKKLYFDDLMKIYEELQKYLSNPVLFYEMISEGL